MLKADYTKTFQRDVKRLKRRHVDLTELKNVIRLVFEDTAESKERYGGPSRFIENAIP